MGFLRARSDGHHPLVVHMLEAVSLAIGWEAEYEDGDALSAGNHGQHRER